MKKRVDLYLFLGLSFLFVLLGFVSAVESGCREYAGANDCTILESDSVSYLGRNISINFISQNNVKLNIDGIITDNLVYGSVYSISDLTFWVLNINKTTENVDGTYYVKLQMQISQNNEEDTSKNNSSYCTGNICKLYEGDTLNIQGKEIYINFLSEGNVKLNIDGVETSNLLTSPYSTDSLKISLNNFFMGSPRSNVEFSFEISNQIGESEFVSLCEGNICKLYEGDMLSIKDNDISLNFVSETQVYFNTNGVTSPSFRVGESHSLGDITLDLRNIYMDSNKVMVVFGYISSLDKTQNAPCGGCISEDKCYPFGYRKTGNFCSDTKEFIPQFESGTSCENNFECSSNVCVSNECLSRGLLQKILNWFKNIFS